MITAKSLKNAKKFCNCDVSNIEGYDEALASKEKYTCHHVLEYKFYTEDLQKMGMYENVSPEFLIWMPFNVHHNNCTLHIKRREHNKNMYKQRDVWNKGLTKTTDNRVSDYAAKLSVSCIGRTPWNKGITKEVYNG